MKNNYKIINEEIISSPKSSKHQLVDAEIELPDGKRVVWQYVKYRDVVCIVAINKKKEIYCVRQWRPARQDFVWELPAGGIELENPTNEQILQNANRELQEEIGLKSNKMKLLASFTPSIHMTSKFYVVLAIELEESSLPKDIDENLEIKAISLNKAYELLIKKQIPSAMTLVGIELARKYLK